MMNCIDWFLHAKIVWQGPNIEKNAIVFCCEHAVTQTHWSNVPNTILHQSKYSVLNLILNSSASHIASPLRVVFLRVFLQRKAPQDRNWYYTDQCMPQKSSNTTECYVCTQRKCVAPHLAANVNVAAWILRPFARPKFKSLSGLDTAAGA